MEKAKGNSVCRAGALYYYKLVTDGRMKRVRPRGGKMELFAP